MCRPRRSVSPACLRGDGEITDVDRVGPAVDGPEQAATCRVQAIGKHEYGLPESQEFVHRLRDVIVPAAAFPAGVEVLTGGGPPFGVDFLEITYGAFPWLVLVVLLLTYVLLVRAFRSLLLPLKAIVLNVLSIGAAYGILVLVFKLGAGEPFGLTQFDQIEGWIPVFLFATPLRALDGLRGVPRQPDARRVGQLRTTTAPR